MNNQTYSVAGMFTTALRWVTGWTYFSAFWRRLILENKLNPDEAGYIGEKFNHFLPNALLIKPVIEDLVTHPDRLWWAMVLFTIIEGVAGLLFMIGLFTRAISMVVIALALGILLGSGWLGTTCLDEWQIGVLGIASGFTIFLSGGGYYSLDRYFIRRSNFLQSGPLPVNERTMKRIVLFGSLIILAITLFTNQYFHGGVYGKLHNLSVKPHVRITDASINQGVLSFTVFRDQGADVYGSFLIGVSVKDSDGNIVFTRNQEHLSKMLPEQIVNDYVAKVKPGKHSLILPLGAKATLYFHAAQLSGLRGNYELELTDISGISWKVFIVMPDGITTF